MSTATGPVATTDTAVVAMARVMARVAMVPVTDPATAEATARVAMVLAAWVDMARLVTARATARVMAPATVHMAPDMEDTAVAATDPATTATARVMAAHLGWAWESTAQTMVSLISIETNAFVHHSVAVLYFLLFLANF